MKEATLRYGLAALIVGALVLCIGTFAWFRVPPENRELLVGLTSGLLLIARDAVRWIFPSREPEQ